MFTEGGLLRETKDFSLLNNNKFGANMIENKSLIQDWVNFKKDAKRNLDHVRS